MGYDFMFVAIRGAASRSFPLESADVSDSDVGVLRWPVFRDWLLALGGRINGKESSIWVDYPDAESINFSGSPSAIYLDTHARWVHVLAAYRSLRRLDHDACVLDCQTGQYYDECSFTYLVNRENAV